MTSWKREVVSRWQNAHLNFTLRDITVTNCWRPVPPDSSRDSLFAGIREVVTRFQRVLKNPGVDSGRVRGYGGRWSLSQVAATDGHLLNTKPLDWRFALQPGEVSADYLGPSRDRLYFAQCGTHIGQMHVYLQGRGASLRTCGASNGQTIAGALSTGTHGSAFRVGAFHDAVVALHMVTGPSSQVWLERQSYPVAAQALIDGIGAELIRDDGLFSSALVGLGAFGIIHGVILETDPIFQLRAYRRDMEYDGALLAAINASDFSQLDLPRDPQDLFHFEVVVNPHGGSLKPRVTFMYREAFDPAHTPPEPESTWLGDDAMAFMGFITSVFPGSLIGTIINSTFDSAYKTFEDHVGTLGEIFGNTTTRGTAAAMAVGVPQERASEALDLVLRAHRKSGPFPGLFALRFVKTNRTARLAFTRHGQVTAVLDFDGVQASSTTAFFKEALKAIEGAEIPCTLHWGKFNDHLTAKRLRAMYGDDDVDAWLADRKRLLTVKMRQAFTNAFMEKIGLA